MMLRIHFKTIKIKRFFYLIQNSNTKVTFHSSNHKLNCFPGKHSIPNPNWLHIITISNYKTFTSIGYLILLMDLQLNHNDNSLKMRNKNHMIIIYYPQNILISSSIGLPWWMIIISSSRWFWCPSRFLVPVHVIIYVTRAAILHTTP